MGENGQNKVGNTWRQAAEGLKDMQNRVAILGEADDAILKEMADPKKTEQAKRFAKLHLRLNGDKRDDELRDVSAVFGLHQRNGGRKNRSKTKRNNKRIKRIRNKYNKRTKNRRYKSKKKYK